MEILRFLYVFLESCTELLQYLAQLLMKSIGEEAFSEPLANVAKPLSSMILAATLYVLDMELYRRMRF